METIVEQKKDEKKESMLDFLARQVTVMGTGLQLAVPRVSGMDYRSTILSPYQRRSKGVDELFRRLYLEGLSSRDFEPALRALIGDGATLSASTILRLSGKFQSDLATFSRRDLSETRFAYVWADGVYLKAGLEKENTALLVLVGVNEKGQKELIALMEGYRESREDAENHLALLAEDLDIRYPKAAACVRKDHDALLRYFDYPKEHWVHLKTSNPIESVFAGVRLRTRVVRRFQKSRTGVAFVYKVIERLAQFWKPIEKPELVEGLLMEREKLEAAA